MRCSFVSTGSPLLCTADVSSLCAPMCSLLSSSSITHLHRYYEAIRLPVPHLPSPLFGCPAYSLCERDAGSPGLPCNHDVRHAIVSDPGEADISSPLPAISILTSTRNKVSSFPIVLTRLIPFSLPAYLLAVLRLKLYVTHKASKDWLTFWDGPHPLDYTTLPDRTLRILPE